MTGIDETSLTDYKYEPLSHSSQIRLLEHLDPEPDGTLSFSLEAHDITHESMVPYFCMSYTWGNPFAHGTGFRQHFEAASSQYHERNKVRALINGKTFFVQRNLGDALSTIPRSTIADYANNPVEGTQGRTYLHGAAGRGDCSTVRIWLQCGADVNKLDDSGNNALHYAAANGKPECIPMLLRNGCRADVRNKDGKNPLEVALEEGHNEPASLLGDGSLELDIVQSQDVISASKGRVYFWADAICINQNDVEEKSAQVSMMDRIYSKASYVVAWLGPSDEHSEAGLRVLNTLDRQLGAYKESGIQPFSSSGRDKYEKAALPYIPSKDWDSLASIYQRQWFRRAWVVQEAVLSPALIVYLGKDLVSWQRLGRVAEAIQHMEVSLGSIASHSYTPASDISVSVVLNMAELFRWRIFRKNCYNEDGTADRYRTLFTMRSLLYQFWTFMASDARDAIFAYNGLLNLFAPDRRLSDYQLTVVEVYTMTTRELISSCGNLHILSACVHFSQRRNGLPSWVPDFGLSGINPIPERYCADKGFEYTPPKAADPTWRSLIVKGCFIGRVSMVGGRSGLQGLEKLTLDRSWFTLVLSLRGKGGYGEKPYLSWILWKTLCMDLSPSSLMGTGRDEAEAPDSLGVQFLYFVLLLILAKADGMIRQRLGLGVERPETKGRVIFSHIDYDPMKEDMEPVLADLDAFEAHDGPGKCWLPSRADVLRYWNNFKFSLLRTSQTETDDGPTDYHLPDGVHENNSRAIGVGHVITQSRIAKRFTEFTTVYQSVYGGRQLITVNEKYLGLASLVARPGDEVWILPGLNAPAVLRPSSVQHTPKGFDRDGMTRFHFMGTSYITGMMQGELVDVAQSPLEDLELV